MMISTVLPLKAFHHPDHLSQENSSIRSEPSGGRITVSRNFTSCGAGKTLLQQQFDTPVTMNRDSGAPLRTVYTPDPKNPPVFRFFPAEI